MDFFRSDRTIYLFWDHDRTPRRGFKRGHQRMRKRRYASAETNGVHLPVERADEGSGGIRFD